MVSQQQFAIFIILEKLLLVKAILVGVLLLSKMKIELSRQYSVCSHSYKYLKRLFMKKIVLMSSLLFFSCIQSKITTEMKEGLVFNYKTIQTKELE